MGFLNILKNYFASEKNDFNEQIIENFHERPSTISANLPNKREIPEGERYDMKSYITCKGVTINVLTIADCHGSLSEAELSAKVAVCPDIVFLLGDNDYGDLEYIVSFFKEVFPNNGIPLLSLSGNHNDPNLLKDEFAADIIDLHRNIYIFNNIRIGGFSGSIRYKPDPRFTMFTNEESEQMLSELADCDILLTHDKPCFKKPKEINSHAGLTGIGTYIKERKPPVVLHGHLHDRYIENYKETQIRCCYRVESFQIEI